MVNKHELIERLEFLENENKLLKSNLKSVLTIQDMLDYVEACDANTSGCFKCKFVKMCNGITTLSENRNPRLLIEYLKGGKKNCFNRVKKQKTEDVVIEKIESGVKIKRGRGRPRTG